MEDNLSVRLEANNHAAENRVSRAVDRATACVESEPAPQKRANFRNSYERLICIVPMVGSGTSDDPRRPLFAPSPRDAASDPSQPGIVAFGFVESDDGRFAIVELVARDPSAFKAILEDKRSDIRVFRKGLAKRLDIEAEFRKYKRDFALDELDLGVF
jgi:hypothetical protein